MSERCEPIQSVHWNTINFDTNYADTYIVDDITEVYKSMYSLVGIVITCLPLLWLSPKFLWSPRPGSTDQEKEHQHTIPHYVDHTTLHSLQH